MGGISIWSGPYDTPFCIDIFLVVAFEQYAIFISRNSQFNKTFTKPAVFVTRMLVSCRMHYIIQYRIFHRCNLVPYFLVLRFPPLHFRRCMHGRSDPSLTLTQFCALLKTMLFSRAYETLPQRLRNSLGCEDRCANINVYLLITYLLSSLVFSPA